ncbi:hypothetical protein OB236_11215 [Paenibacillus sp. WQ 127069]|uniref:Copper amine oxidase N-terminal domain-containing protein n=1 Tax=Paenibacillus baimaensis TaxID=2982185 RepID=A0ABT2UDH0_9BACL|nr:hypothetical protein [Paenibacillus sp. WQ 127069]MCU6792689.1 hypothetical protein [Paenibacillus sp. WQ 127069]
MKKISLSTAVLGICVFLASGSTPFVRAIEIGDVTGQVLSTDIRAYVNGAVIPSLNVNGYTAVAAEDLREYGFDVAWVPQERNIVIRYSGKKEVHPLPIQKTTRPSGTKLADVLNTDITAYYGDHQIPSINIGGRTVIKLNDLSAFGSILWSEKEREITFTPSADDAGWFTANPLVVRERGIVKVDDIMIGDPQITWNGEAVGQTIDDLPMLDVSWIAGMLSYKTKEMEDGSLLVENGANGFILREGDNHADLIWFGTTVGKVEVWKEPLKRDGKWLLREPELKDLFGYESVWSPETHMENITYRKLIVEDHGLKQLVDNYNYIVRVDEFLQGTSDLPFIDLEKETDGQMAHAPVVAGGMADAVEGGPKYRQDTSIKLELGTNRMQLRLTQGKRILLDTPYVVELPLRELAAILDQNTSFSSGDSTRLLNVTPEKSYQETSSSDMTFSGTVDRTNGTGLTFRMERQEGDGYVQEGDPVSAPFEGDRFTAKVMLPDQLGMYRLTAFSWVTNPKGSFQMPVAYWYIQKTDHAK